MDINQKLLTLTSEIISEKKIFGLTFQSVPPTDDRVSCQVEIYDMQTGKTYALQANTIEDVTSLLPRLLATLVMDRKEATAAQL